MMILATANKRLHKHNDDIGHGQRGEPVLSGMMYYEDIDADFLQQTAQFVVTGWKPRNDRVFQILHSLDASHKRDAVFPVKKLRNQH